MILILTFFVGWVQETDAYRRQILTYKDDPFTVKIKIFILAVYP